MGNPLEKIASCKSVTDEKKKENARRLVLAMN